jgi:SAM-dependent methyltransferase
LGFEVVTEADSAYTMVKDLAAAAAPACSGRVSLEKSVALAMDGGSDDRVVPFLPFIFQDVWELGADPELVVDLVRRRARDPACLRVLDLGCGKGAVTVRLARAFGCRCLGLDAIAEFVAFAEAKAAEAGVARLCRFEVADIRERIEVLGRFDVIVLGAIGPVFGDYRTTLGTLESHLSEGGLVIVDDGYLPDESPAAHPEVLKRGEMLRQIAAAGMRIVEEVPVPDGALASLNETLFRALERRCAELAGLHPERKDVFEGYVRRQVEENAFLEGDVVCVLMAIGRAAADTKPEAPGGS